MQGATVKKKIAILSSVDLLYCVCLSNCVTRTVQVTEDRMLPSPALDKGEWLM